MIKVETGLSSTSATFTELVTIEDARKAGSFFDTNNNLLATVLKRTDIPWSDISINDKYSFTIKNNRFDLSKSSYLWLELYYYKPSKGLFRYTQGRYDYRKVNLEIFKPFAITANCWFRYDIKG